MVYCDEPTWAKLALIKAELGVNSVGQALVKLYNLYDRKTPFETVVAGAE